VVLQVLKNGATLLHMRADIHPAYFTEANVTCACGRSFIVGSTREKIEVEICSNCHPFYTGNEKILDAAGRVEKFKARLARGRSTTEGRAAAGKKSK
jgi:large subunit ribosomal protein L31